MANGNTHVCLCASHNHILVTVGGYNELTIILHLLLFVSFHWGNYSCSIIFMSFDWGNNIFMSFHWSNDSYSCSIYSFLSSKTDVIPRLISSLCTAAHLHKWCHVSYAVQLLRLVFMGYIVAMETRYTCTCPCVVLNMWNIILVDLQYCSS